jgi:hypothetical protein
MSVIEAHFLTGLSPGPQQPAVVALDEKEQCHVSREAFRDQIWPTASR